MIWSVELSVGLFIEYSLFVELNRPFIHSLGATQNWPISTKVMERATDQWTTTRINKLCSNKTICQFCLEKEVNDEFLHAVHYVGMNNVDCGLT